MTKKEWTITPKELIDLQKSEENFLLIDVRPEEQYGENKIQNAVNIPNAVLAEKSEELDKNQKIVVYCNRGIASKKGQEILENEGFTNVWNMSGGINEYRKLTDN